MRTALIAGASGLVGGICLEQLLECPRYDRVLAAVRHPLERNHPKLRQIVVQFDRVGDHRRELEADDIFCCLGTTMRAAGSPEAFRRVDHDYPMALAENGRATGARGFFLVSSLGANRRSPFFYFRVKGETEAAVRALALPRTHIFRPGILRGARNPPRRREAFAVRMLEKLSPVLAGPLANVRPLAAEIVGAAMVRAAASTAEGFYIHAPWAIRRLAAEAG